MYKDSFCTNRSLFIQIGLFSYKQVSFNTLSMQVTCRYANSVTQITQTSHTRAVTRHTYAHVKFEGAEANAQTRMSHLAMRHVRQMNSSYHTYARLDVEGAQADAQTRKSQRQSHSLLPRIPRHGLPWKFISGVCGLRWLCWLRQGAEVGFSNF